MNLMSSLGKFDDVRGWRLEAGDWRLGSKD